MIRRILLVAAFLLLFIFVPKASAGGDDHCEYNGTCPTVTVTVPPPGDGGELPVTGGSDTNLSLVRLAVVLVAAGGILVVAARKRTAGPVTA